MRLALFAIAALAVQAEAVSFTYDRHQFYVDDSPLQTFGGEIQPQRIPREFWADRLAKAKAMGLNTIFSYVFWNAVEPQPGEWDFEGQNHIAA
jgi:beta-galactosidase GanA